MFRSKCLDIDPNDEMGPQYSIEHCEKMLFLHLSFFFLIRMSSVKYLIHLIFFLDRIKTSFLSSIITIINSFDPFPNKPWFLHVCSTSLLKTHGKGEIVCNEQFLLFHQCFLYVTLSAIFITIYNCLLQTLSVWKSLKFVVWERDIH